MWQIKIKLIKDNDNHYQEGGSYGKDGNQHAKG